MSRRQNYRRSLQHIVWEACQVYWDSISIYTSLHPSRGQENADAERTRDLGDETFPFASLPPKGPSEVGLTTAQNRVLIGHSITSPEELINYLRQVNQVPKAGPVLQPSRQSTPGISPERSSPVRRLASSAHSPQPALQSRHHGATPNALEHRSEQPPGQAPGSLEQETDDGPKVPETGPESDLDDELELGHEEEALSEPPRTFGPDDLTDLDHWAYAIPGSSPTLYREAPKLPTCGPWEIPLPPTMDPQVHVQPNQPSLQPLLGGVRIQIIQSPPRLKVELSGVQRAAMLRDTTKQVEGDFTALRWRAYRHLLAWAEHLKSHAEPPAERPMDLLTFVRMRVKKETESIRRTVAERIENRVKGSNIMFPGRTYQMPEIQTRASSSKGTRRISKKGDPALDENWVPAKRKHSQESTTDDDDEEEDACNTEEGESKRDETRTKAKRKRQKRMTPSSTIDLSSSPEPVLKREDSPVVDLECT
ncbi:hypothetical protein ACRALDRAFT_1070805 [Sodiomyces alcalophilus JCM 7366]|uniref:uncharacterized protein n=1 Tax=Sodiomyces alcalophilus JCM 7366 TaxID=591952 RepID=UPI0039B65689